MSEFSPGIERVRQQVIAFSRLEKKWKASTPTGMKYTGFRFEPFREQKDGWWSMGYKAVPVFEPLTGATGEGE